MAILNFPVNPSDGQTYTLGSVNYSWDSASGSWLSEAPVGYTGSTGYTGSKGAGYTGSRGDLGYTGSQGNLGYTGSEGAGYTGSQGVIGYTGSFGTTGYTGSAGNSISVLGTVATTGNLPVSGNTGGDAYIVQADNHLYIWDGSTWVDVGQFVGYTGSRGYTGSSIAWDGSWVTATAYVELNTVTHNGSAYICKLAHTSGSTTEPGVGASWTTYWDLMVEGYTGSQGATGYTGSAGSGGGGGASTGLAIAMAIVFG